MNTIFNCDIYQYHDDIIMINQIFAHLSIDVKSFIMIGHYGLFYTNFKFDDIKNNYCFENDHLFSLIFYKIFSFWL